MKKLFKFSLLFFLFILNTACQDVLECVINRHPELQDKRLKEGHVNAYYFEEINAQINNEPFDDSYYYYFTVSGKLPRGITSSVGYRSVVIEGTPLEPGRFPINIHLSASQTDDYYDDCESQFNDCDGLCSESTSKRYTILIR